ncbi:EexN family lipoprotein (plasmid) [Campylobacter coli]
MQNLIKLALLSVVTACVFCLLFRAKNSAILRRSKNATELESKIKECANASSYSKSFNYKPQVSTKELMEQVEKI